MDLLDFLRKKRIKGAALDVLQNESKKNFIKTSKLINYAKKHDNLIITPHIAGVTKDSWRLSEVFIAKKIRKFIKNAKQK